jgi:hypothetical protein
MALEFAKHTDSFELADMNTEAGLYEAPKKAADSQEKEPIGFFNVDLMDAEALDVFSMRHFGRSVNKDKPVEEIRAEVLSMARIDAVFDEALHVEAGTDKHFIALQVNDEDYNAFKSGLVVLKLVSSAPADSVPSSGGGLTDLDNDPPVGGNPTREELNAALDQLPGDLTAADVALTAFRARFGDLLTTEDETKIQQAFEQVKSNDNANENADPLAQLKADLALLDAKELRAMCKKLEIPYANTMSADVLREKIIAAASDKAE